jgi:hypothetical protein
MKGECDNMAEKKIFGRIINKHETEAVWLDHPDVVPNQSEIIVYDADIDKGGTHKYARMKLGDGKTKVNDLPFYVSEIELETKISDVQKQILQIGETKPSFACTWFRVNNK